MYPLPEEHWINQPLISDNPNLAQQLLLQVSVQQGAVEFTQLLVRAGARANMYNDETNQDCLNLVPISKRYLSLLDFRIFVLKCNFQCPLMQRLKSPIYKGTLETFIRSMMWKIWSGFSKALNTIIAKCFHAVEMRQLLL